MTSQLVETSEEDSFLAIARYIGDHLDEGQGRTALADTAGSVFSRSCEELLAEGQFAQLLERFVSQLSLLFSKGSDKEIECCTNLLCHLLLRAEPEEVTEAANNFSSGLAAEVDAHAELRLQALTQLFNVLPEPEQRLQALLQSMSYAQRAGLASLLAPSVKARLDAWIQELNCSTAQERQVCLAAADLLRSSKRKQRSAYARDAFKFTIRALHTFEGASASEVSGIQEVAASAIADFARFQDIFQFDLADSPAITQLSDSSQHAALHRLLAILLQGDVQALHAWVESNASEIDAHQLSKEDLLIKVRLFALLKLASQSLVISYNEIQIFGTPQLRYSIAAASPGEALDIPAEEVEGWVVRAIGRRLLSARMNQNNSQLTISNVTRPQFASQDWKLLHSTLAAWQDNIHDVLELVKQHRTA